jgi:hypothetical protein
VNSLFGSVIVFIAVSVVELWLFNTKKPFMH